MQELIDKINDRKRLISLLKRRPSPSNNQKIAHLEEANEFDQRRIDAVKAYLEEREAARQYMNRPKVIQQVQEHTTT